jgi:hypothetical protein
MKRGNRDRETSGAGELRLEDLEARYRVLGEMEARGGARLFVGERISDGADVEILIARPPEGAHPNALTLYAADMRNLSTLENRCAVPVLEEQWVGDDALAVVLPRLPDRTLAEILESSEELSFPRMAGMLADIHGVLEWARDHRLVHRLVPLENVFVEEGTDRVRVLFGVDPVPMDGGIPAADDARTIASLAWWMITRGRELPGADGPSLAALRPNISKRVAEETDALLAPSGSRGNIDVSRYIATVGMADALLRGEVEAAHMQAELLEEQRQLRAHWEAENRACHAWAEQQARELESEREKLHGELAEERDRLNREVEAQRQELAAMKTEFERAMAEARDQMAEERAEHERFIADQRREIEIERAQLDLSAAALPEAEAGGTTDEHRAVAGAVPLTPEMLDALAEVREPKPDAGALPPAIATAPTEPPAEQRRMKPGWAAAGIGAAVLALVMATVALTYDRPWGRGDQPAAPTESAATAPSIDALVIDSIAGSVRPEELEPMTPADPQYTAPGPGWDESTRGGSGWGSGAPSPAVGGGAAEQRPATTPAPNRTADPTTDPQVYPQQQDAQQQAPPQQQPQQQTLPREQATQPTLPQQQPAQQPAQSRLPQVTPSIEPVPVQPPTGTAPPGDQRQVRTDTGAPRVLNPPVGP